MSPMKLVPLLLLAVALPAAGQTRLERPVFNRNPTPIPGPAKLLIRIGNTIPSHWVELTFPPITPAIAYRVSRSADGGAEVTISEGPPDSFTGYQGWSCSLAAAYIWQWCVFTDRNITSFVTYTYWVRAIYPGPVVSPPGPSATIQTR